MNAWETEVFQYAVHISFYTDLCGWDLLLLASFLITTCLRSRRKSSFFGYLVLLLFVSVNFRVICSIRIKAQWNEAFPLYSQCVGPAGMSPALCSDTYFIGLNVKREITHSLLSSRCFWSYSCLTPWALRVPMFAAWLWELSWGGCEALQEEQGVSSELFQMLVKILNSFPSALS